MSSQLSRRHVLLAAGAITGGLAGCLGEEGWDVDEDAPPEEQIRQFLDGANGSDEIVDRTDASTVRIENGRGEDVSGFAFSPAAVRISQGTTVVWEWVDGSAHTVTHENGDAFDSGREAGAGFEYERVFDDPGLVLYICEPHQNVQRGAILVE